MATTRLGFFGAWAAYLGFSPKTDSNAPIAAFVADFLIATTDDGIFLTATTEDLYLEATV